jgi:hypothetical protein
LVFTSLVPEKERTIQPKGCEKLITVVFREPPQADLLKLSIY